MKNINILGITKTEIAKFNKIDKFNKKLILFYIDNFIKNTPDFSKYTTDIFIWMKKHKEECDIEIAYKAVKKQKSKRLKK